MYKPQPGQLSRTQELLESFAGYDHNLKIPENAFFEEENMSTDCFPVLSARHRRASFSVQGSRLQALCAKSLLCYINDGKLFYGGTEVSGPVFPDISAERQCVSMGAKLVIFPDKIYVNTNDLTDYGSLEATFETAAGTAVTFSLCRPDGTLYSGYTVSSTAPAQPENADLWLDTTQSPHSLKQYAEQEGLWIPIETTYVRISCANIGKNFRQYDGVTVQGAADAQFNTTLTVWDKGDDYLVVTGVLDAALTQTDPLTIRREVPDMDYLCENGNRIWGCSSENNAIYCCKLGDPTNWNSFLGISTDSFSVTVGTDGVFTGAVSYRGNVLFFKENCIHKLYGTLPPFGMTSSFVRGVQQGSARSLVTVNETLYYKSPNGICSYEGGTPYSIADPFGEAYYSEAVGGALRDKYYVCMTDGAGARTLFTYDERRGVWHKEDKLDVREFATHNANLYMIVSENSTKKLMLADGEHMLGNFTGALSGWEREGTLRWSCETGLWGLAYPEYKYISGVTLRLTGENGAHLDVYFQFDSSGEWVQKASLDIHKTGSVRLPFITPRCDHLKMKLVGRGKIRIFSILRTVEAGSGLHV